MSNEKVGDGGPAFPFGQVSETTGRPINGYHNDGMSLRDYFAGQALMGLLSGQYAEQGQHNLFEVPNEAYYIADAMIAERNRKDPEEK